MEGLVWLGLITCIAATLITALGLIVQKHSHNAREGDLPLYRRWRWWIGFGLLVICGGFFDSLALSLAPLSILAPLSGLTIMANVVLANVFLDEPVERIELASTAVIMLGLCFTSVFGSHASPNYDVKSLLELWWTDRMLFYFGFMLLLLAYCIVNMHRAPEQSTLSAVSWGGFASVIGAQQNLCLKCTVELVRDSVRPEGRSQFGSPALYILLAAAIGLATLQLWSLNVGLARFNAVFFLPIYQALLVLAGVLAGGIYFNEFSKFGILDWFGFFTGVWLTILGLGVLVNGRGAEPKYSAVHTNFEEPEEWDEARANARDEAVFL